jgi:uncharacterized protein
VIELNATLMRIFIDESDRRDGKPLYAAIVEELRRNDFEGATVLKGIEGFGAHRAVRTARTFDLSNELPILIEVAESRERIEAMIPRLRDMIPEGLITLERIGMQFVPPRSA